jgi:hypothetical protein
MSPAAPAPILRALDALFGAFFALVAFAGIAFLSAGITISFMLDQLTAEDFAPHIGNVYVVTSTEPPTALTLVDVVEGGDGATSGRRPFELTFTGSLDPYLPQGTYRFERGGDEPLDIFIVPHGPKDDASAMCYGAVFT